MRASVDQFRDITLSPDFPSVAQAIASVYPQTVGGFPIDGALALDHYAASSRTSSRTRWPKACGNSASSPRPTST